MNRQNILFTNAKIFTPDNIIDQGWMLINDMGKIVQIGEGQPARFENVVIKDLGSLSILPGLIDVHVHGGIGYSVMDAEYSALEEISKFHAKNGTTSFLATTTTASNEKIIKALRCAIETMKRGVSGAELVGIHLEGPFINEKKSGAQDKNEIRKPSITELEQIIAVSNNQLKVVTLAPEIENGMDAVKFFSKQGITVSIGHSDANFAEVKEAVKEGARHTTHHFNGMSRIHHREPGVAGAGLILNDLTTEIIADGIHVHPEMVKHLFETKGVWNVCAITDAVFCAGLPDGHYERVKVINGEVYLSDGTSLAGSTLTMIQALKNVISFTGYSLDEVLPSFTLVPARQTGIDDVKGSIEIGKDADFLIVDENLSILSTYVSGEAVYTTTKL